MRHGRSALAYRLMVFVMTFIGGTLFYVALRPAFSDILGFQQRYADTSAASTGASWLSQIWTWVPVLIIFLAGIALIRAAVVERRRSI